MASLSARSLWDPVTRTLHAESDELLDQHTRYALIVTNGIHDTAGDPVEAGDFASFRHDVNFGQTKSASQKDYRKALLDAVAASGVNPNAIVTASVFSTQSATAVLEKIRDRVKAMTPAPATVLADETDRLTRLLRDVLPAGVRDAIPPVQYLHGDDLADAVVLAVTAGLDGAFNVAPDGWMSEDEAQALTAGPLRVRLPRRLRVLRPDVPSELLPYLVHPWVVANDRLRAAGWPQPARPPPPASAARAPRAGSTRRARPAPSRRTARWRRTRRLLRLCDSGNWSTVRSTGGLLLNPNRRRAMLFQNSMRRSGLTSITGKRIFSSVCS